ncbi:MAG: hypothetical protein NTY35_08045 [Planctomycetota bacterium]|nr:hypothetical protein [Planctomycetota bacterium]
MAPTAARVVLLAAFVAAPGAWRGLAASNAPREPVPVWNRMQTEPVLDLAVERQGFADSLREFRAGDDAALPRLVERAERMARLRREDARDVVAFYRGVPSDERRAGLAAETRYETLRAEVAAAGALDRAVWPARRAQILTDLEALIVERRAASDPTPAARALALAAVLDEQRARVDAALTQAERVEFLARAEARARESLAIFARAGLLTPTLEPVWLLARVEDARGNVSAARGGFEDCLDLADRVESDVYRVLALRGLIAVAESAGDIPEQRELLRDLAAIREPKDDWWLARRWAALLLADDEGDAAVEFLSANPPAEARERSQWHFLYGSALQRLGRSEEAEAHFREVRIAPATDTGVDCAQVEAAIWRAQSALCRGDAAGALELAAPLVDTECASLARAQRAYTIGAAHLALGDAVRAESALRGALELGHALEARLSRTDDGAVFGEVVGLETVALLAEALTRQGRPFEAVRMAEEIQARALRSRGDAAITDADLRAWSSSFERGLLTWIVGADTTVCAHVASDGTATAVAIPLGREVLQDAMRRVREAAITGDAARARKLASEIEARVVPQALRERVAGPGRLLLLAHGPLERMPFDLTDLGDQGPLAVLPGLATAEPGPAPATTDFAAWSILGDPSSTEGESVLPGARAEVEAIAALLGTTPRTGDAFDRLALLDALKSGRALHVATHLVHGCGESTCARTAVAAGGPRRLRDGGGTLRRLPGLGQRRERIPRIGHAQPVRHPVARRGRSGTTLVRGVSPRARLRRSALPGGIARARRTEARRNARLRVGRVPVRRPRLIRAGRPIPGRW